MIEDNYTIEACRSCQHGVIWANNTTTNRRAPINAAPAVGADGNVRLHRRQGVVSYEVLNADQRSALTDQERAQLRTSHFATCADAPHWKARGQR